jgi:Domain of unknown function (DUF4180)
MIRTTNDLVDALLQGPQAGLILSEADLSPAFFDLRSGLAGELLQKVVNYRARLAIVLVDPAAHGERFSEVVHDHRRHPAVRFFRSEAEAREWLQVRVE